MSQGRLRTWKIPKTQSFYPLGMQCIMYDNDGALTTYAHHTVNTHIFRNFSDAINDDKSPHKTYLHSSLFPDRIKDVIVGNSESIILLTNGRIMYFTTPKKLMIIDYLDGVKSICCCEKGFALIKLSKDGTDFFVEIHPDAFQGHGVNVDGRKTYNITFDKIPELESTWHQTCFRIKELYINPEQNQFLSNIIPVEILANVSANVERYLFVSMDKSFCSLHASGDDELVVNPITQCSANILDFWMGSDGDYIFILQDDGALEILYFDNVDNEMSKQVFYFGAELKAFHFDNDIFYSSTGTEVMFGELKRNETNNKFSITRKTYRLPGIVAMTYIPNIKCLLCINENCLFYRIQSQIDENRINSQWIELDNHAQKGLSHVKHDVKSLMEAYDNLMDRKQKQQQLIDAMALKKKDQIAIKNGNETTIKYRFVAKCEVTRTPPIQRHNDVYENLINVENPLPYDRTKSYFVKIIITPVSYANEFDNDLWYLRCRWLNYKCENEYANNHLTNGMLSKPLTLIIHLQDQNLPEFELNVITMEETSSSSSLHIDFPVRVEQPDYCEMMDIAIPMMKSSEIDLEKFAIIGTIYVPGTVTMTELISDKLVPIRIAAAPSNRPRKTTDLSNVFIVYLLGMELTGIHYAEQEKLQLLSNSPELMHAFKKYIYRKFQSIVEATGDRLKLKVPIEILKEYRVREIC